MTSSALSRVQILLNVLSVSGLLLVAFGLLPSFREATSSRISVLCLILGGAICCEALYAYLWLRYQQLSQGVAHRQSLLSYMTVPVCGLALGITTFLLVFGTLFNLPITPDRRIDLLTGGAGALFFVIGGVYPVCAWFIEKKVSRMRALQSAPVEALELK